MRRVLAKSIDQFQQQFLFVCLSFQRLNVFTNEQVQPVEQFQRICQILAGIGRHEEF